MDDEYDQIITKPLKIAKKKSTTTMTSLSLQPSMEKLLDNGVDANKIIVPETTKAQKAFLEKQGKLSEDRIMKKASKTHKQRVEEFNQHLDSLSEFYDIPKVSWTK